MAAFVGGFDGEVRSFEGQEARAGLGGADAELFELRLGRSLRPGNNGASLNLTLRMRCSHKKLMKRPLPGKKIQRAKPIEETYRQIFREQVSPLWVEEDSDFSLEQPAPVKVVPSVTTYGVSEEPIVR